MNLKIAVALILAIAIPSFAADKSAEAKPDAAMQEAMKLGQPGEAHKNIAALEGSWSATYRHRMKADTIFEESKAASEHKWIYGGRFLQMAFKGDMAGQPMEGVDVLGYDNFKKEYQMASYNNMNTGIMLMPGKYDAKKKKFTFEGTFACAMTGEQEKFYRSEWTIDSKDQNTFVMFFKDDKGVEFKAMEGVYKRAKSGSESGK